MGQVAAEASIHGTAEYVEGRTDPNMPGFDLDITVEDATTWVKDHLDGSFDLLLRFPANRRLRYGRGPE